MLAWYLRATRRVASLRPDMAASLLKSLDIIRDSLNDAELARLIANGDLERLFAEQLSEDSLNRAFIPFRARLRQVVERGFELTVSELPKAGRVDGVLAISFDHLNPRVIDAIRGLESDAINSLKTDVKEVVRAAVEAGLRDGRSPTAVARELRSVIGLAPSQEVWVRNLRAELESGNYADAARRKLIDQRFKLSKLDAMSATEKAKRIDTIVTQYRKSAISLNANVNAKAHTFDAYKQGQALSWQDAKDKGVIPEGFIVKKKWVHCDFSLEVEPRPEHVAMSLLPAIPADQPYENGDTYAGEGDPWNCKCLDRFSIAREEVAA